MRGREMPGWLRVSGGDLEADDQLTEWVSRAVVRPVAAAQTLARAGHRSAIPNRKRQASSSNAPIQALSDLGLGMLLFLAGLEIDIQSLRGPAGPTRGWAFGGSVRRAAVACAEELIGGTGDRCPYRL